MRWAPGRTMSYVHHARIIDVIAPMDEARAGALGMSGIDMRWWMPEQYGFIVADVEPLPFVPWKGALGLFKVPEDYATVAQRTGT